MLDCDDSQKFRHPTLFEEVDERMTRVEKKEKLLVSAENMLREFAKVDDEGTVKDFDA